MQHKQVKQVSSLKPNTVTQLLAYFVLAISANLLSIHYLLPIFLLIVLLALHYKAPIFRMLQRFKWFFLVTLIVFAFNTPGEHLANWPFAFSPTFEGLQASATQLLRIITMLMGLSLVLANNTRQQLISGFYYLLSPLNYFGLAAERFAARLWLTLYYVETAPAQQSAKDLLAALRNMTQRNDDIEHMTIQLEKPMFTVIDYSFLMVIFVLISTLMMAAF